MIDDDKDSEFNKTLALLAKRERAVLRSPLGINFAGEVSCKTVSTRLDNKHDQFCDCENNVVKNIERDLPAQNHRNEERCSFCGSATNEVPTMIKAASGAQICRVCVNDCLQILRNDE